MFDTLLIANRGEIACRVAATARRLGLRTVAVFSDADAHAAHVAACDTAVRLGSAAAKDSYLRADLILEAAKAAGAQAVHPGYGFLSENEDFAQACTAAGIAFVGPPAQAIAAMGSKSAAKALMERAGVPLVPGYHGDEQDPRFLAEQAGRIGYPVLIKASAGGGGKGMRIVERADDFEAALASCQREARASFGDDRVLVERYLQQPRHIEIQVFADTHGNCLYLFERDCSVQRRHQKVLEEAPAPALSEATRRAMGEAAVAAARAVGYVGAGTVEFIATQSGEFFFMEMNTRLQVEHPVTEMITGFDLVEWQLRVAAGEPLPVGQEDLRVQGHAIEARLYAENPEAGFLPSIGTLARLRLPEGARFTHLAHDGTRAPVRVDAGVRQGDAITPHYDPMIAKIIVHGQDRAQALARMRQALAQVQVVGLHTNAAFLARVVAHEAFARAQLETGLIERHREALLPTPAAPEPAVLALAVAGLLAEDARAARAVAPWADDPFARTDGWRMGPAQARVFTITDEAGTSHALRLAQGRDGTVLHVGTGGLRVDDAVLGDDGIAVTLDGARLHAGWQREGETLHVFHAGRHRRLQWRDPLAHAGHAEQEAGGLTAPMPGKVIAVLASPGERVTRGTPLLVMEAMKMEHTLHAPADGVVGAIRHAVGEQVAEGTALVEFEADAEKAA